MSILYLFLVHPRLMKFASEIVKQATEVAEEFRSWKGIGIAFVFLAGGICIAFMSLCIFLFLLVIVDMQLVILAVKLFRGIE